MSTTILDVHTPTHEQRHPKLELWVEEMAQMCKPDRVYWCDGSDEEIAAMQRYLVLSGIAIPLDPLHNP